VSQTGKRVEILSAWVRALRRLRTEHGAERIVPIFDSGHGWRAQVWPAYKSNRKPHAPEVSEQIDRLRALTRAMVLPVVEAEDTEADDLIAAYTEAAVERGLDVVIVSTDKDMMQLIRDGVRMLARGSWIGPAEVEAAFGVCPSMLADLLALMGDRSDAIPGVSGIGIKTAARLLRAEGSLDALLDRWMLVPGKTAERLRDGAEDARMSRRLVTLRADLPLPIPLDAIEPWVPRRRALDAFFSEYGYPRFESAVDPWE
jgi:DNA polymerase-1